jgi:hypothetical protein
MIAAITNRMTVLFTISPSKNIWFILLERTIIPIETGYQKGRKNSRKECNVNPSPSVESAQLDIGR